MYISQNIRFLRKKKNLTQTKLGELLDITDSQITRYEKGKSEPPVSKLILMADLFDVNLQDLIFTDLSNEKPQFEKPEVPYGQQDENSMIAELNEHLRKRVLSLERNLKEVDPELARELGIE